MSATRTVTVCLVIAVTLVASSMAEAARPTHPGFRVPQGFVVREYASDDLAHNIYSMTIDAKGRVVVAGPGYVKILHDDNADKKADRFTLFSDRPRSGAHGMVFDGPDLICTGDNAVMRLRDTNGDGEADGEPEVWTNLRHREHGANGLTRGPDGWFYLMCGNDAGVSRDHAREANSPVRQPSMGAVVRFSPDGKRSDVFAHGFRNPYDLTFNAEGNLFTVDADGERDYMLPWYAPTRLFDIAQGRHHGWVLKGWKRSWSRPAYFFDNVPRLVEIGRGSPTGMATYRHREFPTEYWNGVFSSCWTLGKVYFFPLKPKGSSYEARMETFLETTGHVGFAPVDLAVGPSGDLFVAIGGRDTRGGVFRVSYEAPLKPAGYSSKPIMQVLAANQPLSSWSRAQWVPLARKLGREPFENLVVEDKWTTQLRMRAIEVLLEVHGGIGRDVADAVVKSRNAQVVARLAWALGRQPQAAWSSDALIDLAKHGDARVRRSTWEALHGSSLSGQQEKQLFGLLAEDKNPLVRASSYATLRRTNRTQKLLNDPTLLRENAGRMSSMELLAQLWLVGDQLHAHPQLLPPFLDAIEQIWSGHKDPSPRLELVRLLQIALGDIDLGGSRGDDEFDTGYTSARPLPADLKYLDSLDLMLSDFPTNHRELDLELARLAAMARISAAPRFLADLPTKWTDSSKPEDDVHFLIVAAHATGKRGADVTRRTADALASLHAKIEKRQELLSRNWPKHVGEAFTRLSKLDPALPQALAGNPAFGHAENRLFAERMPGELKAKALAKLPKAVPPPAIPAPTTRKIDHAAWKKRLADVDWSAGDAERGKSVFQQRACAACHAGSRRLGPSLKGIATRFGRDDLFLHTADPNLAISRLYKATQITTRDGQVHIGIPVYDSPAATILDTGPAAQVRVTGDQILRREAARLSPMPADLLREATDLDLADLYAYLKRLR